MTNVHENVCVSVCARAMCFCATTSPPHTTPSLPPLTPSHSSVLISFVIGRLDFTIKAQFSRPLRLLFHHCYWGKSS